jgi:hypothetical protein
MFLKNQPQDQQQQYQHFLKIVGSLSNLYSDSKTPYLYYRITKSKLVLSNLFNNVLFESEKE